MSNSNGTNSSGLFGASPGLFGINPSSSSSNSSTLNNNTTNLFSNDTNSSVSQIPAPVTKVNPKPSVLSRLAKRFNIFREPNGIFTSNDFPSKKSLTKDTKKIHKPFNNFETRSSNEIKKLIIKSKPMKYHLINADKVLKSKQWRVMPDLMSSDKLLNDEDSDEEIVETKVIEQPVSVTPNSQGYWTSPALNTLDFGDITNIEYFIIGRKGYGQIAFNLPVDLTDFKLKAQENGTSLYEEIFEDVVEIGSKYVKVYKDDKTKPQRGYGLNVPATISLEQIKPKHGDDISDFIRMLKSKPGMEFITYDPITFVWTFKVEHFSIWGLTEDDSEEYLRELKRQKLNNETSGVPGSFGVDNSILQLKKKYLTNEMDSQIKSNGNITGNGTKYENILDSMDQDEPIRENYQYLKQLINILPKDFDMNNLVAEKAYEPEVELEDFDVIQPRPNLAISDDWLVQLKLSNELNSSLASYTKVKHLSIQSVDNILFHEFNQSTESSESKEVSTPSSKDQEVEIDVKSKDQDIKIYETILPQLLAKAQFEKRANNFFKVVYQPMIFGDIDVSQLSSEFADIITLSSILFDTKISDDETQAHIDNLTQKNQFRKWLSKYNESILTDLISKSVDDFERILIYLICGNIKCAVELASDTGNSHLSAALTSVDSGYNGYKQVAKSQLEEYEQSHVPANLIKIFKFMAGEYVDSSLPWSIRLESAVYYSESKVQLIDTIKEIVEEIDQSSSVVNILKYYCKLPNTLSIGLQWLLSGGNQDDLSTKFGEYLERLGLWKQSVFIYSYISKDLSTERSIKRAIKKNIKQDNLNDEEPFLTNILKIPVDLIYESVGADMDNNENYWEACDAFIIAKSWTQAHEVIVKKLGPETIVSKDPKLIKKLISLINKFPNEGKIIPNWSQGAGIYRKYFKLLPLINNPLPKVVEVEDVESLLENVPLLKLDRSMISKATITILTRDIGELARGLPEGKEKIMNLPLGENEVVYFART